MSEAKFTKGDWSICLDCWADGHVSIDGFEHSAIAVVVSEMDDGSKKEELSANAHLITASPKMYKMLESVASELYMLIDEVNDQRASHITPQTESEPDYHDMQTIHEIQCLLAEARGVDIESS